jgi:outer membrane biosynthesis protein TonB
MNIDETLIEFIDALKANTKAQEANTAAILKALGIKPEPVKEAPAKETPAKETPAKAPKKEKTPLEVVPDPEPEPAEEPAAEEPADDRTLTEEEQIPLRQMYRDKSAATKDLAAFKAAFTALTTEYGIKKVGELKLSLLPEFTEKMEALS